MVGAWPLSSTAVRPSGGRRVQYASSVAHQAQFIGALLSGGDSRVAIDPRTCTNKYACPSMPSPDLVCFSSCTASPISQRGFQRAGECYDAVVGGDRAERLQSYQRGIEDTLLWHFGAAGLADVILCPSGTDALLTATTTQYSQGPSVAGTAIVPSTISAVRRTGSGSPPAALNRR